MKNRNTRKGRWVTRLGVFVLTVALGGCSGIKTYPNNLEKNLQLRTQVESGSAFSKLRASMSVFEVNAHCQTEYQGTVDLDEPSVQVGIPSGHWSYLVFDFSSSGFLSSTSTSVASRALLKPQAGSRYDIDVSYRDDIYNVTIHSVGSDGTSRDVPLIGLEACQQV
jgi:hypothetical protein